MQVLIPVGFEQRRLTEEEAAMDVDLALTNAATASTFRVLDSPFARRVLFAAFRIKALWTIRKMQGWACERPPDGGIMGKRDRRRG